MIISITGKDQATATLLAQSLRSTAGSQRRGTSIIRADDPADIRKGQVEKLIDGVRLEPGPDGKPVNAADIPWKKDPVLIVIGEPTKILEQIEALVPGFKKQFGPVSSVPIVTA